MSPVPWDLSPKGSLHREMLQGSILPVLSTFGAGVVPEGAQQLVLLLNRCWAGIWG